MAESIQQRLQSDNPFFSDVAAAPWLASAPLVPSVNAAAYETLQNLIVQKGRNLSEPLAGLVLGPAGAGKTQLIGRILQSVQEKQKGAFTSFSGTDLLFVFVKPLVDPLSARRTLLWEIALALWKKGGDGRSQLESFAEKLYRLCASLCGNEGFSDRQGCECLLAQEPELDVNLLKALMSYRRSEKRGLVLRWLKGESLDGEERRLLGGVESREGFSLSTLEMESQKIIDSLGLLMKLNNVETVLCFDQLDGMTDRALIGAFGELVSRLVNQVHSMLPLLFMRKNTWEELYKTALDSAVVSRLSNQCSLKPCTDEEAKEILRLRLRSRFDAQAAESMLAWLLSQRSFASKFPREVIQLAKEAVNAETQLPTLADKLAQEQARVLADFDSYLERSDYLYAVLKRWLENNPDYEKVEPFKVKSKYACLRAYDKARQKKCEFFVDASKDYAPKNALYRYFTERLSESPGCRCYYISGNDYAKPSWNKTLEAQKSFCGAGGVRYVLSPRKAAEWYGLMALIEKVKQGDLSLNGAAPVTQDQLAEFLRLCPPPLFEGVGDPAVTPGNPAPCSEGEPSGQPQPEPKTEPQPELPPVPKPAAEPAETPRSAAEAAAALLSAMPAGMASLASLCGKVHGEAPSAAERDFEKFLRADGRFQIFDARDGKVVLLEP